MANVEVDKLTELLGGGQSPQGDPSTPPGMGMNPGQLPGMEQGGGEAPMSYEELDSMIMETLGPQGVQNLAAMPPEQSIEILATAWINNGLPPEDALGFARRVLENTKGIVERPEEEAEWAKEQQKGVPQNMMNQFSQGMPDNGMNPGMGGM